jgi:hypothetical protein
MRLFGRKRKQEEDGLGLPSADDNSGLSGLSGLSGASAPLGSVSVSVTPSANLAPPAPSSNAPPVMPVPTSSAAVLAQLLSGHGPVGELVKQIRSDPQAFRQRMLEQVQASGASAFVLTPQGVAPIGHPPGTPVPKHVDVIDELTKAADLHDKGALTDEEFEQFKHKLLGH